MKAKVVGTYVSLLTILFSLIMVIIGLKVCSSFVITNIGYGLLGSGVVSFIMTFSEYFVCKREVLENYYSAALKVVYAIYKIQYFPVGNEVKLIAANKWERLSDTWRKDYNQSLETKAFDKLCRLYLDNGYLIDSECEIENKKANLIIQARQSTIESGIENAISSCLAVENISLNEIENVYGQICFILDFLKLNAKKERFKIYNIHENIRNQYNKLRKENLHFDMYVKGDSRNLLVVVDKLQQVNVMLFSVKQTSEQDSTVWATYADNMFDRLEQFRCNTIYHKKYVSIEKTPVAEYHYNILNDVT